MLDQNTKRKIDSVRQILVGKVPDPKAQVEQITIALIYKFMDDMDKESEELGGDAKFFANGFSKYAWTKLLDQKLSGQERLDLYTQSISSLSRNQNIPQLFRDIFKGAFLPYNDPRTLSLFLKEINEFTYEHSEDLGDAFEYLLSVLGSQGDAGQFRTPRHIIDFMVAVMDPKKNEKILDPACGTAGFLISAYKHILNTNKNKPLSPDEKLKLMNNLTGYDISPDMVKLALVNMYLHGFPEPKIHEYDTLSDEKRWDENADVILANPPFMSPKGGIQPHKRFSVQSNRSEVLFVDYMAEHLTLNGRAGIIVPEGIIFQSAGAYKQLRKYLIENDYLYAVVSLPAGVFNPYSGVKTSILFLDRVLAKKTDKILFAKVEADGLDLGAQRKEIEKDDLPHTLEFLNQYKIALQSDVEFKSENKNVFLVEKKRIIEKNEYNLSVDRYRKNENIQQSHFEILKLGDVAEVISGQSPESEFYNEKNEGMPFYQGRTEFGEIYIKEPKTWTTKITKTAIKNDILMSVRAPVGPVNIATQEICIGRGIAAIRPNEKILLTYLFTFLKSIQDDIKGSGGAVFDSINRNQIMELEIPVPPISIQQQIANRIESFQKIIEGSKQVVENYKPLIQIDASWEMVRLGDVLEKVNDNINPQELKGNVQYIGLENIEANSGTLIGEVETAYSEIKSAKTRFSKGDLLYGKLRPNLNKVYLTSFDGICSTDIFVLRERKGISDAKFYAAYLRGEKFNTEVLSGIKGAQLPRVGFEYFSEIEIPVPPISVQQEIVNQIGEEQALINSNKKLIEIFELKIKDEINRLWTK